MENQAESSPLSRPDAASRKGQNGIPEPTLLLVIPESQESADLRAYLLASGFEVIWARDGEVAYNVLDSTPVDVLVAHLHVHRIDGMGLLHVARRRNPEICAIMIADRADLELATEAMRQGAYDSTRRVKWQT